MFLRVACVPPRQGLAGTGVEGGWEGSESEDEELEEESELEESEEETLMARVSAAVSRRFTGLGTRFLF